MKTNLLVAASLLAAVAAIPASPADPIEPTRLPPAVRKTLYASTHGDPVKEITAQRVDGRIVYNVELDQKNAPTPRLRIAEDGRMLPATTAVEVPSIYSDYDGPVPVTLPRLKLDELSPPVQDTIRREAGGREIGAITPDFIDGHRAYAVEFREPGRNPLLYLGEDGAVLRPTEKPPVLGLGTTFSATPAAVQQTVRREIGRGEILRVDREKHAGEPDVYKFSLKDARGPYQLHVSADGRVLETLRSFEPPPDRPEK